MEFLELPQETQEHIFWFVEEFNYAFCCKTFYGIFLHNKKRCEEKALKSLIQERNAFACLPKFSSEMTKEIVVECANKTFLLPLRVHIERLLKKDKREFFLFCKNIGEFGPSARKIIPECGWRAFSFGDGERNARRKSLKERKASLPEFVCGFVHHHAVRPRYRRKDTMCAAWICAESLMMNKEENLETSKKLSVMLGLLGKDDFLRSILCWRTFMDAKKGIFPEGTEEFACLVG
ncbi:hypothetical protein A9K97_gp133 [Tokyovirus A1]|uniref:hypothetical protein n=1 Tax=Tokyovirus A1 TaxID=1826170 RepID=UPI0007A98314|nr:hypothetical protein A9K97_gp133 [Tokyovirus A1]BAU80218.1 hypothetical protein [Tokyovirus A1]